MPVKAKPGLGKGLSALLGEELGGIAYGGPVQYVNSVPATREEKAAAVQNIDLALIEPNPFQPRVNFDTEALEELAASIRTLGLIQPVTLRRKKDGRYQIISGERRFRASKMAGLSAIPAYIREADDAGMLEMAIVENVQRADLDPIETAMSYRRLIEECSLTQEKMAERIGKSRVSVTNMLRLLNLPAKVQYDVKLGKISVGHAKVLSGLEDPALQESLSDAVIRDGLSVRALEQRMKALAESAKPEKTPEEKPSKQPLPQSLSDAPSILAGYSGGDISYKRSASGVSTMTVRFTGDENIRAVLDALREKLS